LVEFDAEKCSECMLCMLICSFIHSGSFNVFKAKLRIVREKGVLRAAFSRDCEGCGKCVEVCCYGALR